MALQADHATSTARSQDYKTENAALKSKISSLQSEIQEIQALLDSHKHCSKYPQITTTALDSKAEEAAPLKFCVPLKRVRNMEV
ncbi:hypothetical protein LB505_009129 [Fusarium chuoi]|nr:hypothetical protein LB505_009129 [Fusarium chuoi]